MSSWRQNDYYLITDLRRKFEEWAENFRNNRVPLSAPPCAIENVEGLPQPNFPSPRPYKPLLRRGLVPNMGLDRKRHRTNNKRLNHKKLVVIWPSVTRMNVIKEIRWAFASTLAHDPLEDVKALMAIVERYIHEEQMNALKDGEWKTELFRTNRNLRKVMRKEKNKESSGLEKA
ncbi:hypothetical protein Salat_0201600 [Sesamum alatum]|uniref:Uncharacterized protein n=1 Tax=Sesamum alatum TaxID=300844 RepID=A0AAE1YYK6_9LAMI|nr:hypothetical protein Salat_0201600 [Sesamum alatum]